MKKFDKTALDQLTNATRDAIKGDRSAVEIGIEYWRKARKKPVVVEFREPMFEVEKIHTREGTLIARRGKDYVIKGIKGELYPISKEIFYETYEIIEDEDSDE